MKKIVQYNLINPLGASEAALVIGGKCACTCAESLIPIGFKENKNICEIACKAQGYPSGDCLSVAIPPRKDTVFMRQRED